MLMKQISKTEIIKIWRNKWDSAVETAFSLYGLDMV